VGPIGPDPVKIMITGDSLTNMSSGDYTWRYFLWKFLAAHSVNTDFVGDFTGTLDNVTYATADDHDYADCNFDRDHEARGGALISEYDSPVTTDYGADFPYYPAATSWITGATTRFTPNVVVEFAGVNDLMHYEDNHGAASDATIAASVVASAHTFVQDVQAVDPDTDVIVVSVPAPAGSNRYTAYNTQLAQQYASWSIPGHGQVALLTLPSWTDHTWDGWHPDGQGDARIATAMAAVLHNLEPATFPAADPVPTVEIGPRETAVLSGAAGGSGQAQLTWTTPPGSDRTLVYRQDPDDCGTTTQLADFRRVITDINDPSSQVTRAYTATGLAPGHHYTFYVRSAKGNAIAADLTSNTVSIVGPGAPSAAAVCSTSVAAGLHAVTVSWSAAVSATGYNVYWRKAGTTAWMGSAATTLTSHVVTGLAPAVSYQFAVAATQTGMVEGPKTAVKSATPKAYVIAGPAKPKVAAVSGHKLKATWAACAHATRYLVQVRLGAEVVKSAFTTARTWTSAKLTKRKTYTVRVQPYDGVSGGTYSAATCFRVK
jgi:lysophospholipase L1-like esterase